MAGAGTLYAGKSQAVTPNDVAENIFDALYVGGAGDISLVLREDDLASPTILFNVQGGSVLPVRTKHILSTDTTATNIVGLTLTA